MVRARWQEFREQHNSNLERCDWDILVYDEVAGTWSQQSGG